MASSSRISMLNPGSGKVGRAGLEGRDGQRRYQECACFGLPPGVHDLQLAATEGVSVPHPGLWVDGLTDRSEQP